MPSLKSIGKFYQALINYRPSDGYTYLIEIIQYNINVQKLVSKIRMKTYKKEKEI